LEIKTSQINFSLKDDGANTLTLGAWVEQRYQQIIGGDIHVFEARIVTEITDY
jgi:hypothetical protein